MTGQVEGKVALVTGGASGTELVIDGGMNAGGVARRA